MKLLLSHLSPYNRSGMFLIIIGFLIVFPMRISAQEKPLLSEEIRKVLDSEGIEAAKTRFSALYPDQKGDVEVDSEGLAKLAAEYMQNGDMQTGMAVMEMVTAIAQGMVAEMMGGVPEQRENADQNQTASSGSTEATQGEKLAQEQSEKNRPGEAREDLGRFMGLYAKEGETDPNRRIFVSRSCDGYLITGAMWGDVSPFWMTSSGASEFAYSDDFQSFRMQFILDAEGNATGMTHTMNFVSSPLDRVDGVPASFAGCFESRR